MKKVVLAFSGGLDTSYCAIYLAQELGLEVYSAIVDTGGFSEEELKEIIYMITVPAGISRAKRIRAKVESLPWRPRARI